MRGKKAFDPEFGDDAKLSDLGPAPTASCEVCHDANAKNLAKLRITGSTPELKGGFKVTDAGNGAVCILCHNSRRGMRNDKVRPVTDKRAPHEASSAAVAAMAKAGWNLYIIDHDRSNGAHNSPYKR